MRSNWLDHLRVSLENSVPPGSNVARELADLLGVSPEGAYRRLRGQTAFLMEELILIRETYGISLDALAQDQPSIQVQMHPLFTSELDLMTYLKGLLNDIQHQIAQPGARVYCFAADIPFFRLMGHPYICLFKLFYWQKSILGKESFKHRLVDRSSLDAEVLNLCQSIYRAYAISSSIEIWNEQTINGTLKQIEYYADCSYFLNGETLAQSYAELYRLISGVSEQAHRGSKTNHEVEDESYSLWSCELVIDNNSVLIESETTARLAIGFNSFNTIQSSQKHMVDEYKAWMNAMLSKSTQLSGQSDKHRVQFIQSMFKTIRESAQNKLSSTDWIIFEKEIQEQ
ncbi:MAG: hypothetical protein KDC76_01315 [Bacteroidetes bacterium]|nr:hypothetical protein [Bacteroidota bacterium]